MLVARTWHHGKGMSTMHSEFNFLHIIDLMPNT